MANIIKNCNIEQAFNFKKDKVATVGHIHSLEIGTKDFNADFKLINPVTNEQDDIVGAMRLVSWDGGKANPIELIFNISTKNKQLASELIYSELSNIEIEVKFITYDYDPVKKTYYESLNIEDPLSGIITKHGENLAISMQDVPSSEVLSPENYEFKVELSPKPEQQVIGIAFSQAAKMAKEWGVTTAL